jgi:ubiquinone/menaquinone biosynthesis C-methylase UbiE
MTDFDQAAPTYDEKPVRLERAQAVAQGIRASVRLAARMTALEYGCGTGLLSLELQPFLGHILLADSSSGMLAVLDEKIAAGGYQNLTSLKVDLITDPLPAMQVQLIYSLMVLHHIPETDLILKRFYALLESPGTLCVADLDREDGSFHDSAFSGHKGFDRARLGRQVRRAGFRNARFQTVFNNAKMVGTSLKDFPLFLMVAEK